ncbi:thermostable hemolysin [Salinivibrio kushneri]|uniref:thermostable hemolysin n=1 Tax=Salinivibrio kushneri TaxID=1908198 RepID=UPI0022B34F81|nr:thermostable hemolysin [Salinivibrio kushneri]WBA12694.1 thermostable hemolysin [Salinivibrio kushneri]
MSLSVDFFSKGSRSYSLCANSVVEHYYDVYEAKIKPSPHQFVCLKDSLCAAPGLACAGLSYYVGDGFFCEKYLEGYGKSALEKFDKKKTVEFGSFCSFYGMGNGRILLGNVLNTIKEYGYENLLLTANLKVRSCLSSMGVQYLHLGGACEYKVWRPDVEWGRYYESKPEVIVVPLDGQGMSLSVCLEVNGAVGDFKNNVYDDLHYMSV